MTISIIAAMSDNRVLGKDNDLVWHLPDDMKHFKKTTSGHAVIMGRKTFESFGKPLKNRENIIITRKKNYDTKGAEVVNSVDNALKLAGKMEDKEIFIIGGGEIYKQTIPYTDRIYLTIVHHEFDGDTFFPELDLSEWQEKERKFHNPDERHLYPFTILILEKKQKG